MGCPRITYYQGKEGLEKSAVHFFDRPEEKSASLKKCNNYYPFGLTFNSYTSGTENLYKWNGMEEQKETGWYQPAEYRMYQPDLGRFFMIDPVIKEHESPYAWNTNNPIAYPDPLGSDGDYYTEDGKHLGSDGIDDNKTYVVSGATEIDKWGSDGPVLPFGAEAQELDIGHDEFQKISGVIKHEAGTSDGEENLWIAHTANNAAQETGNSLYDKLMSGYSSAPKDPLSTSNNSSKAQAARAAAINVLNGGSDPTGGSTLWDGTDFMAWGLNSPYGNAHAKFRQYSGVTISPDIFTTHLNAQKSKYGNAVKYSGTSYKLPHDVFFRAKNWHTGTYNYSTGQNRRYSIEATGSKGRTIFWKKIKN